MAAEGGRPRRHAPAAGGPPPPAGEDPWVARARPGFLYVMYALLLGAVPVGVLAAISPARAAALTGGVAAYLAAIPEPLYALFGTGYLGYTAAREWGKAKARGH